MWYKSTRFCAAARKLCWAQAQLSRFRAIADLRRTGAISALVLFAELNGGAYAEGLQRIHCARQRH